MNNVVIVGRPNVGKSALFNRLIQKRKAIVEDLPGITRDRLYAQVSWRGKTFNLIDTGGLDPDDKTDLRVLIDKQTKIALKEANLILFLVDGKEGLNPLDWDISQILKKEQKKVILAVNKIDNFKKELEIYEFCSLNFDPFPISAIHGLNIGDLLDLIVENLTDFEIKEETSSIKIALAGRPNVGKSSIFNCMAGEERSIVHEIPGTTRDSINTEIIKNKEHLIFIDTAGLRHKSKIKENVEYFSVLRTHRAILEADIVLLILEPDDLISQDKKIAGLILKENKASLIVINKWDLIKDKLNKAELIKYKNRLNGKLIQELDFINYSPIVFVSAKTQEGMNNIFKEVNFIYGEFTKKIEDKVLNRLIQETLTVHPPPTYKGKYLKIYNVFQSKIMPPTFTFKVNEPKLIHFSYKRYLENKIRQTFGFNGTPIIFKFN